MKNFKFLMLGILCASLIFSSFILSAQDQESELDYSYGRIISISQDKIELNEYDYDVNEEVNVIYFLDPSVELRNVNSLGELSVGDNIEVDYVIRGGKKIIKVINLETNNDSELDDS